jgi:hypothetical protein
MTNQNDFPEVPAELKRRIANRKWQPEQVQEYYVQSQPDNALFLHADEAQAQADEFAATIDCWALHQDSMGVCQSVLRSIGATCEYYTIRGTDNEPVDGGGWHLDDHMLGTVTVHTSYAQQAFYLIPNRHADPRQS